MEFNAYYATAGVTIGRNYGSNAVIGGVPLDSLSWDGFQAEVRVVLGKIVDITVSARGVGEWQGIKEENYHAQGVRLIESLAQQQAFERAVDQAEDALQRLARHYWQDAIAFNVGRSVLVFR